MMPKERDFTMMDENGDGVLTIDEWKIFVGCWSFVGYLIFGKIGRIMKIISKYNKHKLVHIRCKKAHP